MDQTHAGCGCCDSAERRSALKRALGAVIGLELSSAALAQNVDPRSIRPQPGDHFVLADGSRPGAAIALADLPAAAPQTFAFPFDPVTKIVRDGSRLNKILLLRLDPEALNDDTRRRTVEGVAAYSAICTHQGCEVINWDAAANVLWCPCHDSKFDPRESARVVGGPAQKRLAALPLKAVDGVLTVAAGFSGPVGFQAR